MAVSMPDLRDLSRGLASIHAADDEEQTLARLLDVAMTTLNCDMAGVMLVTHGRIECAAVTSPTVREADLLQVKSNEGPCLSAIHDHRNFRIDRTDDDPRWPRWGPQAARIGVHSVLSVRMGMETQPVGSLNLYAARFAAFGSDDDDIATILAHNAAIAYLNTRTTRALRRAVDTRTTIGQAEGMLMERFTIDADTAFSVLRRYSQAHNAPLREVARGLVEKWVLPATDSEWSRTRRRAWRKRNSYFARHPRGGYLGNGVSGGF